MIPDWDSHHRRGSDLVAEAAGCLVTGFRGSLILGRPVARGHDVHGGGRRPEPEFRVDPAELEAWAAAVKRAREEYRRCPSLGGRWSRRDLPAPVDREARR